MSRSQFLDYVRNYVATDPEAAAYVSDFVAAGLQESRKKALERASDMEAALAVAVTRRHSGSDQFVLDILKKWNGAASLEWGRVIALLEGKSDKHLVK
jgi:hypothetical protein